MLAKILKSGTGSPFQPFVLPRLDDAAGINSGISQFVAPAYNDIRVADDVGNSLPADTGNSDMVLHQARKEAARIIAEAEDMRAAIEQAAHESAEQDVARSMEVGLAEQVADLRAELLSTIEQISSLGAEIQLKSERSLVELALQIAKKIVGREVTIDREVALTLVKVSLAKLHNRSIATVHLNPTDFAFVQTHRERLDFRGSLELVEDRSIGLGGCLIRTETGDIDARIDAQFDEISHGLLG